MYQFQLNKQEQIIDNAWSIVYPSSMAKGKKKEHDFAVTAFKVVQEATEQVEYEQTKPRKDYD